MAESADRSDTNCFHIDGTDLSSPFSTCLASPVVHHRNDVEPLIPCPGGTDCYRYDRGENLTTRGPRTDRREDRWCPVVCGRMYEIPAGIGTAHRHRWVLRTPWIVIDISDSFHAPRFAHGEIGSSGQCQRHCPTGCSDWTPICLCVAARGLATRYHDVTAGVRTISRGGVGVPKGFTTPGNVYL